MTRLQFLKQPSSLILAITVGYSSNLLYVWFCIAWIDVNMITRVIIFLSGGILIGALACRLKLFDGRRSLLAICAFFAALTLWLPVIIATYGFAILGTPILALYSFAVTVGWRTSAKFAARSD